MAGEKVYSESCKRAGYFVLASDTYTTPAWLTARLPIVDLDPCSNPRSTVRARRTYSLERRLDGLKLPWARTVFLNWPYSDPTAWASRLVDEIAAGRVESALVLCKLDTSTSWWRLITVGVPARFWTFTRRLEHGCPPELETSTSNFCSALVEVGVPLLDDAYTFDGAARLWKPA